jgi:hypothetical protein
MAPIERTTAVRAIRCSFSSRGTEKAKETVTPRMA